MYDEIDAIVLDSGSALTKAGRAGEETPSHVFPTVKEETNGRTPIKNGIITNWEDIEDVLQVTFTDKLQISPENNSILLTQPPFSPKKNKEKIIELTLEKFRFPRAFIAVDAALAHLASGKHAVVAVQIGHGVTSVVPIEGLYPVPDAIVKSNTSGGDVTEYLRQNLEAKGLNVDARTAQDIKETLCYISDKTGSVNSKPQQYTLPDSTVINLEEELYSCGEVLFNPLLLDREAPGIHEMIYKSIMKCSIDSRRLYWNNIILSGGSSEFKGLEERLSKEFTAKLPANTKFNIMENKNKKTLVWIGGSMLASLSTFDKMCVSKKEYDEVGVDIVYKKCFNGIP